jgi:hypothetical protein
MAGNGPQFPTIDTTVKASGAGSMKQPTQNGVGQPESWFTHFGVNKTHQLNPGDEVYVQYRYRFDPVFLVNSNWPGSDGFKQDSFSLGDLPSCASNIGNSAHCTTTCQSATIVTQNAGRRGTPIMYMNCGGPQAYTSPQNYNGSSLFTQPAFSNGCAYPGPYQSPQCFMYVANEWMTFKKYIKMGSFNQWDNVVKMWAGREGQPLQLLFHCGPGATRPCNYGHDGGSGVQVGNGWLLTYASINGVSGHKLGKVYLLSYQTCTAQPCSWAASGNVWYDELVISTKDIADPGGVASTVPSSPSGLTASGFVGRPENALWVLPFALFALLRLARRGSRTPARSAGIIQTMRLAILRRSQA